MAAFPFSPALAILKSTEDESFTHGLTIAPYQSRFERIYTPVMKFRPSVLSLLLLAPSMHAIEPYRERLMADAPVAYWRFDQQDQCCFPNETHESIYAAPGHSVGLLTEGPRPPKFPSFAEENTALDFTTKGAVPTELVVKVKDPGAKSVFDFTNGETITVEAWVKCLGPLKDWQWVYIAGKGRTRNAGVAAENQNWGVRLLGDGKLARASFLFRSTGKVPQYHRWNSNLGFTPGDEWHHVAMSYTFGKPESMKAWIDGQPSEGVWDDAGPTTAAPVVDDDEVWIGSSLGVQKSSTFPGLIDELAIYRTALSDDRIKLHAARAGEAPKLIDGGPKFDVVRMAAAKAEREGKAAKPVVPPKPDLPMPVVSAEGLPRGAARVEIFEFPLKVDSAAVETFGGNDSDPAGETDTAAHDPTWSEVPPNKTTEYTEPAFALTQLPQKYSARGVRADRSRPYLVRMAGLVTLPEGEQTLHLRALTGTRVALDGKVILQTPLQKARNGDTEPVPDQLVLQLVKEMPLLPAGHREVQAEVVGDGKPRVLVIETWVGGKSIRPELGELSLWSRAGTKWELLGVEGAAKPGNHETFVEAQAARIAALDAKNRKVPAEEAYWEMRHKLARENATPAPEPPAGPQKSVVDRFIAAKLALAKVEAAPLVGDAAFLRRVTLDTIGLIPSAEEVAAFLADKSADKRARAIDRLLADSRWAGHWTSYWQDVLAENPNILKGTLNNTGPFRWWLHESLLDNKSFDRFATELISMEGSANYGGPAGFSIATQNDLPMAAKAQILGGAFLAMEMKCARCHDAPAHIFEQGDLFKLAAMLQRAPLKVPGSSLTTGLKADSHVVVTLKAGQMIEPHFPFAAMAKDPLPGVLRRSGGVKDSREMLAAILTDPRNDRFARVVVNRMWKQFMGFGIVEPVDDWETSQPSHKELLQWLGREFITHGYDLKHVARLVLNSDTYQRASRPDAMANMNSSERLFAAQARRRLTAEQLLDSIMLTAGQQYDTEMLTFDPEARQNSRDQSNLGVPRRAWEFTSLSNERDRPALAKPKAQMYADVLVAFGWRESRPEPKSTRDHDANVLQPALLANGTFGALVTRAHDDSAFTELALRKQLVAELVRGLYLRVLSREPSAAEVARFTKAIEEGYESRLTQAERAPKPLGSTKGVSWANHLNPDASTAVLAAEKDVKAGPPPSPRLTSDWRDRYEDAIWAMLLSPEFAWVP